MRLVADMTGHTRLVQLMLDIPEDAEAANVQTAPPAERARQATVRHALLKHASRQQSRCASSSMACEVVSRRAGPPEACT